MKKVFLPIVVSLSFLSCKNDSSELFIKENYSLDRTLFRYSAVGSMVVDINCPNALPGDNDWTDKDIIFSQSSPINLISNVKCDITIKKYTTATGVTLIPESEPAILKLNESGSGSFDHVYYKTKDGTVHEFLSASALNYDVSVYENSSFPVIQTNGSFVDANANLEAIIVSLQNSQVITIYFSTLSQLPISTIKVNTNALNSAIGTGVNDWTVANISSCTNICSFNLTYKPTKAVSETKRGLVIDYQLTGSATQSISVPIKFKTQ
jgi:hypothetical protein